MEDAASISTSTFGSATNMGIGEVDNVISNNDESYQIAQQQNRRIRPCRRSDSFEMMDDG